LRLFNEAVAIDSQFASSSWNVLNAQDALTLRSDGGPVFYWVSGALLREDGTLPTATF
jgi:hypothetical protein